MAPSSSPRTSLKPYPEIPVQELLSHPAIADSAVIGLQDEGSGEIPKAFVVIKEGESPTSEEIMRFIAGQVATFKQIRQVQFVDSIPKNASGKILRRVLIEQERGGGAG